MSDARINPLEKETEDLAQVYVDLVYELMPTFAPFRPWWSATLTPDQALWRWAGEGGPREEIVTWLMAAGVYMGWKSPDEVLLHMEDLFTKQSAADLLPPEFIAQIPTSLLEMVQGAGPHDTVIHIRKMEKMFEGRQQALAVLANTDQPNFPEPPLTTPALPIEATPGSAGYPLYGGAPQELSSKKGIPSPLNLAGG